MNSIAVGSREEGKSTLALYLAYSSHKAVFVFDPRGIFGGHVVHSGEELEQAFDEKLYEDEHGKLQYASETVAPKVGEKLRLVPGHCDPTVDRFDWYIGVRNGRVECLWPVAARGGLS